MSDILVSKTVTTRKEHQCFGCAKRYPPRTRMERSAVADCGTVFTTYTCETCQEVIARTFESGDEYGCGEIYGGDSDYWNEVHQELHGEVDAG